MDHPYSFWADVLSKFQGSTPWIQALWLVLVAAVAMGVIWCVADFAKHAVTGSRRTRTRGTSVYGLVQDADGRWLACFDGEATPAEALGASPTGAGLEMPATHTNVEILPPRS
jgi:hypothetical protein